MYISIVERKAGPLKKEVRSKILEDLTSIVEQGNALGQTQSDLAAFIKGKYNINIRRQTISDLMKEVYSSIEPQDITHIQVKLETMFDKVFSVVQDLITTAETPAEKRSAVDLLVKAMDRFTQFLESFGIKEKIADKIDLSADITTKQIYIEYVVPEAKEVKDV